MNENIKDLNQLPDPKTQTEEKQKRHYSTPDIVFAWLSYFFGYLFCRVIPIFENTLGGFCFVLLIFAATFTILKIKKIKISKMALIISASALVLSPAIIIANNDFLIYLAFCYIVASYCYFVFASFGNTLESGISDYIFMDYIKAIFIMPIYSITRIFEAISYGKAKNSMKQLLKILSGLALAAIPTIVIFVLLSYDEGFISIFEKIFDFDTETVFSHIASLIFAVPLGMYIFSLFTSSGENILSDKFTASDCNRTFFSIRIMPQLTALTAALPIILVYIVYFVSQWQYYISGFTGVLPENFSYATYAREGFFQLCAVSFINLVVIIAIVLFTKRKGEKTSVLLKILTTVFCFFTLVLISTAIAKLAMYIDSYGLTQKRVYAMWFMALIAAVFIVVAIGKYATRMKTIWTSLLISVIFFAALSLSNVNGIIAEYNVNRYLDGELEIVDIEALNRLDDASVPALVRLAEALDERKAEGKDIPEEMYMNLKDSLESKASYMKEYENSIFEFNIPAYRAKSALAEYGLIKE